MNRAEYIMTIRKMHQGKRLLGLIGCVIGVLLMIAPIYMGAPGWLRYAGLAVVAASWMVFLYVIVSRTRWVKAHPFDPGT